MAKKSKKDIDFSALQETISRQFRNLDPKDPSLWPVAPKILLCLFISIAVAAVLWFAKINEYEVELETEIAKEQTLRQDYQAKLTKAVSLEALKRQREQVQQYVIQLEKQLPSKAELRLSVMPWMRGAATGTAFGLLPGPSPSLSTFTLES